MCSAACWDDPRKLSAVWIMTACLRWIVCAVLWCRSLVRVQTGDDQMTVHHQHRQKLQSRRPAQISVEISLCHSHPLSSQGSVAMIMNTNLSSDCVQLCLSVLLKIADALCQSSKGTLFLVSLSRNCFPVIAREWSGFCPPSCSLNFHVVLNHYETILWTFSIFQLYLHSYNNGSSFRQSLVADICFYMQWPKGLESRIHRRLIFLCPCCPSLWFD